MAGIELCKFAHGLGLDILRFYTSLSLGVKFEYKGPDFELFVFERDILKQGYGC
jgi:hypothetical protein